MNWQEVYDKLNGLDTDFVNLDMVKDFLSKEENYETKNNIINIFIFYFINSLKNKVKDMPNSLDDVRNILMSYGNDINTIVKYLDALKLDFNNIDKGMKLINALILISDKDYDYEDGYENSLRCKNTVNTYNRISEIYDNDKMTIEEKCEYCVSFENGLSDEEKGELHIQTFIGKEDKVLLNKALTKVMLKKVMTGGNTFSKAKKFEQCFLNIGAYAEKVQENASLEENLKMYANILESPFYKSLSDVKHI